MTSVETRVYEYLDDITSYSNVHTGEGTGQMLGSFGDTDKTLNKIECNRTAPGATEIGTGTDRTSEILHLQVSQQRSDDPRRGGRMSSDVRKTWSTELVESTIGNNPDEADDIFDGALRNGIDNPYSEFGTHYYQY